MSDGARMSYESRRLAKIRQNIITQPNKKSHKKNKKSNQLSHLNELPRSKLRGINRRMHHPSLTLPIKGRENCRGHPGASSEEIYLIITQPAGLKITALPQKGFRTKGLPGKISCRLLFFLRLPGTRSALTARRAG